MIPAPPPYDPDPRLIAYRERTFTEMVRAWLKARRASNCKR